jgi:hypothetical protein
MLVMLSPKDLHLSDPLLCYRKSIFCCKLSLSRDSRCSLSLLGKVHKKSSGLNGYHHKSLSKVPSFDL